MTAEVIAATARATAEAVTSDAETAETLDAETAETLDAEKAETTDAETIAAETAPAAIADMIELIHAATVVETVLFELFRGL